MTQALVENAQSQVWCEQNALKRSDGGAVRDRRDSGLHEHADAAREARTVPAAKKCRRATCTTRSSLASWIRCLSPRAVSRRDPSPALASEGHRPVVHQVASALEQIRPCVGRLGGGLYRMGERGLDHFAGCGRPFRGPVPEARPEPMRHGGDAECLGQSRERHGGEWLPAQTAEHEAGAIAQFLHVVQDRERPTRERDAVIPPQMFVPTDPELPERLYRRVDGRWIIADITCEPTLYTEVSAEIADGWRKHYGS